MSLRKVTSLGSNLASVTDLKKFKLHTVYAVILEAINLYNSLVRWQSSSLSPSLSTCLAVPEGIRRFRGQNQLPCSWASLLLCFCAGWTGKHKHRVFPSLLQSLLVAKGLLEENMLPLLWYWLSSRVNKALKLCKFQAATSHFFFMEMNISMELAKSCCQPKPHPSLRSIFLSFIHLWAKIWHRNKTACSELNPVQSSRSKLTTCLWKGRLLIFKSNSTATIWLSAKAGKGCQAWFWIDCNQRLQPNRLQIKYYVWKPCSDQRWQDKLWFSIWRFFEQSAFVNIHLLCYWPTILNSILKICPKFQVISSDFF